METFNNYISSNHSSEFIREHKMKSKERGKKLGKGTRECEKERKTFERMKIEGKKKREGRKVGKEGTGGVGYRGVGMSETERIHPCFGRIIVSSSWKAVCSG